MEIEIDELEGIGPATKDKLNVAGIITVLDLAAKSPSEIADAMNSDLASASELCNKARTKLVELRYFEDDFVSASENIQTRKLSNVSLQVRRTWMIFSLVESKPKP